MGAVIAGGQDRALEKTQPQYRNAWNVSEAVLSSPLNIMKSPRFPPRVSLLCQVLDKTVSEPCIYSSSDPEPSNTACKVFIDQQYSMADRHFLVGTRNTMWPLCFHGVQTGRSRRSWFDDIQELPGTFEIKIGLICRICHVLGWRDVERCFRY
jgi:hypothetical protein